MKSKLTLTIDPAVTHKAKTLARQRGMSLSAMVERSLSNEVGLSAPEAANIPFSERWKGSMTLTEDSSARFEKLNKKYGLSDPS